MRISLCKVLSTGPGTDKCHMYHSLNLLVSVFCDMTLPCPIIALTLSYHSCLSTKLSHPLDCESLEGRIMSESFLIITCTLPANSAFSSFITIAGICWVLLCARYCVKLLRSSNNPKRLVSSWSYFRDKETETQRG